MHTDRYISVNHCNIRYRDTAISGPALLLTHGIGGSLETWEKLCESLGQTMRIITWDLPGHGLSDFGNQPYGVEEFAEFAWQFLKKLGVEGSLILAGNSMGAAISIHMSALQPKRVNRLILLNSSSLGNKSPLPFRLMSLPGLGDLMAKPSNQAIKQQMEAIFYDSKAMSESILPIITRNVMREGAQKAFVNTLRRLSGFRGQHKALVNKTLNILKGSQMPVLFIHGEYDAVIPAFHSQDARALTPNSSLTIIPKCGHTPQLEQPKQVCELLKEFIAPKMETASH